MKSSGPRYERETIVRWEEWMLTPCIEWRGYKGKDGYGQRGGKWAHRLAWTRHHGPIPKGMYVLHKCDNPPCVNTYHLFLGTQKDNIRDMIRKGRRHKTLILEGSDG